METSLGIFETKGFAAAVAGAERILEDKNIELIKIEKTGDGIISFFFKGESDRLKTAFEKGIHQARSVGEIIAVHITNQLNKRIERLLFLPDTTSEVIMPKIKSEPEKIIAKKVEPKIEKVEIPKKEKILEEVAPVPEKDKSAKFLESSSTIQRLRREALSTVTASKERASKTKSSESKSSAQINLSKLDNLNVHELRRLARSTNAFPIQGREISKANRKELIVYFEDLA